VAAIERLLAGTPLRSTGELTVVQLAAEADVKRWKLTHEHVDLRQRFQAQVQAAGGESTRVAPWKARVAVLEADNHSLRQHNSELQTRVHVYAELIHDLDAVIAAISPETPGAVRPIRR
jgi:hypothetical protein